MSFIDVMYNIGIGRVVDNVRAGFDDMVATHYINQQCKHANKEACIYPEREFYQTKSGMLIDKATGTSPASSSFEEECALSDYAINVLHEPTEIVHDTIAIMKSTIREFGENDFTDANFSFIAAEYGCDKHKLKTMINLVKKLSEYSGELENIESYAEDDEDVNPEPSKEQQSVANPESMQVQQPVANPKPAQEQQPVVNPQPIQPQEHPDDTIISINKAPKKTTTKTKKQQPANPEMQPDV